MKMQGFHVKLCQMAIASMLMTVGASAADTATDQLQRGLLEEEANHNLPAAIKAYEAVVKQADEQRRLVATAMFRLGECYRKLGRTNDAAAQYQRVLRDFSDQAELAALSRGLVSPGELPASEPNQPAITTEEREALAQVKSLAQNSPDLLQTPGRDGLSQLQLAARNGHYHVLQFILSQNVDPNGPERGASPLFLAAGRGHLRLVQYLLDKGANVNSTYGYKSSDAYPGQTPLMVAAANGFRSMVELLIDRGADVNRVNEPGASALHYAVAMERPTIVELLLKRGCSPNLLTKNQIDVFGPSDGNGTTPIHLAAGKENTSIAEMLLKAGALATATNYAKATPLHLAASLPNPAMCALLLDRGGNPNAVDRMGNTPLRHAIASERPDNISLLLAKGAEVNRPIMLQNDNTFPQYPVHLAVSTRNPAILHALLAHKPDLEVLNKQGKTALLLALATSVEMTDALLAAGADPNHSVGGDIPIMRATANGAPQMIAALLEHGANPNVMSNYGESPLSWAEKSLRGIPRESQFADRRPDIEERIRLLRQHGASENLSRLFAMDYTRPAWTAPSGSVFHRGTNDMNRYTLFELLAAIFTQGNPPAFPDLSHATIERIESTNAKPKEISLNIEEMLCANDCSKDMWLAWGDRLSIPEQDHPLNEQWPGLPQATRELLERCLERHVQIIVKQETNTLKLVKKIPAARPSLGGVPVPTVSRILPPTAIAIGANPQAPPLAAVNPSLPEDKGTVPAKDKPEKTLQSFRLKEVVYGANVLRASSDPTRVRILRVDRQSGRTQSWEIDLTKVQTDAESTQARTRNEPVTPPSLDLWLRDGDVIEVPDR